MKKKRVFVDKNVAYTFATKPNKCTSVYEFDPKKQSMGAWATPNSSVIAVLERLESPIKFLSEMFDKIPPGVDPYQVFAELDGDEKLMFDVITIAMISAQQDVVCENHEFFADEWGGLSNRLDDLPLWRIPFGDLRYPFEWTIEMASYSKGSFLSEMYHNGAHRRFIEIAKVTTSGARPDTFVKNPRRKTNQLWDAWFLWLAEFNTCDWFLTTDYKLQRLFVGKENSLQTKIITPLDFIVATERRIWNVLPKERLSLKRLA